MADEQSETFFLDDREELEYRIVEVVPTDPQAGTGGSELGIRVCEFVSLNIKSGDRFFVHPEDDPSQRGNTASVETLAQEAARNRAEEIAQRRDQATHGESDQSK